MSKQTGYARNIFFSIIISIVILLTLGFFSIKYLVPIYDLQSQDIYQFLIYLLPVLIGLALIEIGSIIAAKNEGHEEDGEDLLPKNSYDAPLFNTISDDPSEKIDYNNFSTITPVATNTYSYRDTIDAELAQRFEKYTNLEVVKILDLYESDKKSNKVESPFDEELTNKLFNLSSIEAKKALHWLEQGCPLPDENAVILSNLEEDTIEEVQKLSQREARMALDFINRSTNYANLENLNESNLHSLSLMDNEEITKAVEWVHMGCPKAADPNARVFENLDKDTLLRLEEYNSIQVNVGLDYIDDGAPDVQAPNAVVLPNISSKTIDRLLDFNDTEINKGLDSLELDFLNNLNEDTIERLNSYSTSQINSGLDYIDQGQPVIKQDLPFDEEVNEAIRSFSSDDAIKAVNYVKNIENFDSSLGDLSNNLEDFLNSELNDNKNQGFNFDVTIAIFDKENALSDDIKDILLSKLPTYTYVYDTLNNNKAIIFPYEGKLEAMNHINSILNEEASLFNNVNVKVGYAAQENRQIDAKTLINEAYLN